MNYINMGRFGNMWKIYLKRVIFGSQNPAPPVGRETSNLHLFVFLVFFGKFA